MAAKTEARLLNMRLLLTGMNEKSKMYLFVLFRVISRIVLAS